MITVCMCVYVYICDWCDHVMALAACRCWMVKCNNGGGGAGWLDGWYCILFSLSLSLFIHSILNEIRASISIELWRLWYG